MGTAAADWRALARPLLPEAVRFSGDGRGEPLAALRAVEIAAAVPESSRTGQPVTLADLGPMRV